MKRLRLIKFVRVNDILSIVSNIITTIASALYTYFIIFTTKQNIVPTITIATILLISIIVILQLVTHYINANLVVKINRQRILDSNKLNEMFMNNDVSCIENIEHMQHDISSITSRY